MDLDPSLRYLTALVPEIAAGAALPRELVLFRRGMNATAKGSFLFDDRAAELVLAQFAREGVDCMIDLEHYSLSKEARLNRSDAQDARGWFQVRVDPDGSLVMCNATWTPDGESRLRNKTQRYISPVFHTEDAGNGIERVTGLVNAALCARPATYGAAPLVAASKDHARAVALSCASRASCYVALSQLETLAARKASRK